MICDFFCHPATPDIRIIDVCSIPAIPLHLVSDLTQTVTWYFNACCQGQTHRSICVIRIVFCGSHVSRGPYFLHSSLTKTCYYYYYYYYYYLKEQICKLNSINVTLISFCHMKHTEQLSSNDIIPARILINRYPTGKHFSPIIHDFSLSF